MASTAATPDLAGESCPMSFGVMEDLERFLTPADATRRRGILTSNADSGTSGNNFTEQRSDRAGAVSWNIPTSAGPLCDRDSSRECDMAPTKLPVGIKLEHFVFGTSIDRWLMKVERIAQVGGYTNGSHYRLILTHLPEDVQALITVPETLKSLPNLGNLQDWLRKRSRPLDHQIQVQKALISMSHNLEKENIQDFAYRLYTVLRESRPDATMKEAIPWIWNCMDNRLAAMAECYRSVEDPADLLLSLARCEERIKLLGPAHHLQAMAAIQSNQRPQGNAHQQPAANPKTPCRFCGGPHWNRLCPTQNVKHYQTPQTPQTSHQSTVPRNGRCYACGASGHFEEIVHATGLLIRLQTVTWQCRNEKQLNPRHHLTE